MISVSSVDFLLIYGITGRQRSHADHDDDHDVHDDDVDDVDYDVGNDDTFSFVENTFGVITATRSLSFSFPPCFCFALFVEATLHCIFENWRMSRRDEMRRDDEDEKRSELAAMGLENVYGPLHLARCG